ncbi:MAG: sulfite exporter TauE/SafE family protein, partial [Vicinamibacteria bacterium]|nr:sulfite exporter TauE/SafE family protein [Vicinamibacteria bacterium]
MRMKKAGPFGAVLLGATCAIAFCPVSAALFFGSLIPLAVDHRSPLWLPGVYGIGTGLPVVAFAVLLGTGVQWVGKAFNRVSAFETWARRVTAAVIILVGAYYSSTFILGTASVL